ncbi:hypothetical protein QBC45DRAFT_409063 [Copromyces sp. CBS 386.78]|nr:hypothetical protein QBC45DRAFT_409063 [Copromyces sp. CBS 386.78]
MADAATQPTGACGRGANDPDPTPTSAQHIEIDDDEDHPTQPMEIDNEDNPHSDQPMEIDNEDHPHSDQPHALFTTQYNTFEELAKEVKQWGKQQGGYQLVKSRSTNFVKDFGYTTIDFVCTAGSIRPSIAHSRSTSTAKRGCP